MIESGNHREFLNLQAIDREEYFRRLVFAVAFCNSRHDDVLRDAPKPVVDFFNTVSRCSSIYLPIYLWNLYNATSG